MKIQRVEIEWDDASSLEHGWTDPDTEEPEYKATWTIGYLVKETETYVVVCSTTDEHWVNNRFQIPKSCIRTMIHFDKPKPRKPRSKDPRNAQSTSQ